MSALLAHAGEEALYVLIPIAVIVLLGRLGKRRDRRDGQPPGS